MVWSKQEQERIEMQFDSFCKKVLRNRARDLYQVKRLRRQHEVLLSELHYEPAGTGGLESLEGHAFAALGHFINIESDTLTEALRLLPERKRMIILLSYFFDMTDHEIGEHLHAVRSSIQAARSRTLREMRDILEGK